MSKESVFVLDIHFSNCKRTCDKLNFYDKLDALENTLNNWKRWKLTLLGNINIVKSLGLSKLIFIASVLPVPEKFFDQVNKITFNFIWDNKMAKIKRNTIIGECENLGLNMIDSSLMNKALKCIWIKRFRLNEATSHLGGFSFLSKCYCRSKDISIKELPLFYKRTLQYWFEFKDTQDNTKWGIKNMIIWNNKDFKLIIILSSFKLGLVE